MWLSSQPSATMEPRSSTIRRRGLEDRPPLIPADAFGREKVRFLRSSCAEALALLHRDPDRTATLFEKALELSGPRVERATVEPMWENIRYFGADEAIRAAEGDRSPGAGADAGAAGCARPLGVFDAHR